MLCELPLAGAPLLLRLPPAESPLPVTFVSRRCYVEYQVTGPARDTCRDAREWRVGDAATWITR